MKSTKYFLYTIVCILWTQIAFAQDPGVEFTNRMNHIFQYVNSNTVATGLLKDYGLELLDIAAYNGIPADTNYVTMDVWRMLYSSLYTCRFGNAAVLASSASVFDNIDNAADNIVALMHFNYQELNESALQLGYITVTDDQIHLVAGKPLPYLDKGLFAVAPKQVYCDGPVVSFVFKPEYAVGNTGKTVQAFDIDFDDGAGFVSTSWNTPLSCTYSVEGQKTITFRVRYTDGSSYSSRTNIMVLNGATTQLRSAGQDVVSVSI